MLGLRRETRRRTDVDLALVLLELVALQLEAARSEPPVDATHSRMARSCALIAGGFGALWPEPMRRRERARCEGERDSSARDRPRVQLQRAWTAQS